MTPAGSWMEDALRLLAVLQDRTAGEAGSGSGGNPVGRAWSPDESGECRFCPVCQALAGVRRTSPETYEQITAATGVFLDAVRDLIADAEREWAHRGPAPVAHIPIE